MYWAREVLRSDTSMAFNQTFELDLPRTGILGSLGLLFSSTQNGYPFLTAAKWRLIDYLSKIEVIGDGSEVIKSYDGKQALACSFYDQRVAPLSMWRHYSNTPHRQDIIINFGRALMDDLYALDLSKFDQVKLRVTNTATSSEFSTDIKATVVGYFLREAEKAPAGWFREEEWKLWTPTAGATEYSDLPTALKIRRILLRARPAVDTADAKNNSSMTSLMDDIEFSLRTGAARVYKGDLSTLGHLSIPELGVEPESLAMIDRTDEYGFEVGVGYVAHAVKSVGTYTAAPAAFPNTVAEADVQDSSQVIHSRTADAPLEGIFKGFGYMHNVPLFVARASDLSDMLDPDKDKVVKVDIACSGSATVTGTAWNAQNGIILSRLVTA